MTGARLVGIAAGSYAQDEKPEECDVFLMIPWPLSTYQKWLLLDWEQEENGLHNVEIQWHSNMCHALAFPECDGLARNGSPIEKPMRMLGISETKWAKWLKMTSIEAVGAINGIPQKNYPWMEKNINPILVYPMICLIKLLVFYIPPTVFLVSHPMI